jgi:hypothetical protein
MWSHTVTWRLSDLRRQLTLLEVPGMADVKITARRNKQRGEAIDSSVWCSHC